MFFSVARIVLFVREQPVQRRSERRIDDFGAAQAALVIMSLMRQEVPFATLTAHDLPAPGL
jgi:hypothetical protein